MTIAPPDADFPGRSQGALRVALWGALVLVAARRVAGCALWPVAPAR